MDGQFWLGIVVSAVLGLLASIAANLYHAKIANFLDKRKLRSQDHQKKKSAARYQLISRLHSGERDRYMFVLSSMTQMILAFVLATTSISGISVILALGVTPQDFEVLFLTNLTLGHWIRYALTFFLLFSAYFGLFITVREIRRLREIISNLYNFEEYQAAFRARWGPDLVQPPPPQ